MEAFLTALDPQHAALLNGVRQYLHRMVVCLEDELLPYIPHIIKQFLTVIPDQRSLSDFLVLIQQIVSKFKVKNTTLRI